ncbi:MAG: hypothetical protein IJX97_03195 [Clostridia bacterium]|nr:hypothetical protein [Clostridia bacterium]
MRSSKYHDYRVLKVVLFIVLVVLGLLIYVKCIKAPLEHVPADTWVVEKEATCTSEGLKYLACVDCGVHLEEEVIPKLEHTAGNKTNETIKESTCTVGGSHYEVVRCEDCGYEISRVEVPDDLIPHTPGKAQKENPVEPTHVKPGSYDMIVRCTECGAELSDHKDTIKGIVVPELGHDYEWNLEYDEENGKFVLNGSCTCDEEGNNKSFTEADGLVAKFDDRYAPCCVNRWYISFTYYGETFEETVELPTVSHKVGGNADIGEGDFDIEILATRDSEGNVIYYDWSSDAVRSHIVLVDNEQWNSDGLRYGFFVCSACDAVECDECWIESVGYSWIPVWVYSAEYDTTLEEEA